ncbi:TPA: hypothetical protein DCZ31_04320 [Patescibacteria group bacterium]|nr:hypothetical protein [Candidatus Gracilibacteria bacterium]
MAKIFFCHFELRFCHFELRFCHFELRFCHFERSEKSLLEALLKIIISKFNFSSSFSLKRFDLKGFLVSTRNDRKGTQNDRNGIQNYFSIFSPESIQSAIPHSRSAISVNH